MNYLHFSPKHIACHRLRRLTPFWPHWVPHRWHPFRCQPSARIARQNMVEEWTNRLRAKRARTKTFDNQRLVVGNGWVCAMLAGLACHGTVEIQTEGGWNQNARLTSSQLHNLTSSRKPFFKRGDKSSFHNKPFLWQPQNSDNLKGHLSKDAVSMSSQNALLLCMQWLS